MLMRNLFLSAWLLAALAFGGCSRSQTEPFGAGPGGAMRFSADAESLPSPAVSGPQGGGGSGAGDLSEAPGRELRGVIGDVSDLNRPGQAFSVWGRYRATSGTGPFTTLFDNETVRRDPAGWHCDGAVRYWFPGFTYDFHALYPASTAEYPVAATWHPEEYLSVAGFDATRHIDLMEARRAGMVCLPGRPMGTVGFRFRHLLSRLGFVVKPAPTLGRRTLIVREARLYGMTPTGDYVGTVSDGAQLVVGRWTPTGRATDPATPFALYAGDAAVPPGGLDLFGGDRAILMIPQPVGAGFRLDVTYSYADAPERVYKGSAALGPASAALARGWEAGRSYRYPVLIGDDCIRFEPPSVTAWQNASGGNITVE